MTDRKNFEQKFIKEVTKKFGDYINYRCDLEAYTNEDPVLSSQDLAQEIYIHIYKQSTKAAMERSTDDNIWLPHIDMIIKHVFINTRLTPLNMHKRLDIVHPESSDRYDTLINTRKDKGIGVHELIEQKQMIEEIASKLSPNQRKMYYEIVNPSPKFKIFLIKKTPKNRKIRINKSITAKYFGISYKKCLSLFKSIEAALETCKEFA
ncbi:MAG: hypothetical protein KAS39_06605 [Actinomycetia bacterium]|nr:hypothetical protein [Actinomycetes bacterium]